MNYNPFAIEGKKICITGASSGIGRTLAIECAKMGAQLYISGRNKERLNDTFSKLDGSHHTAILADLSVSEETRSLADQLPELDGIVHSAGFSNPMPFQFLQEADLAKVMQVNFHSPVLLSQILAKKSKLKRGSSIVFISSISGVYCSAAAGSGYSASKGAVNGIAKAMAIDLARNEIRVNSVNPGMINTGIVNHGKITQEQIEADKKRYPLKRYGEPIEVAHAVVYLLSDAAKWVTGSNLLIDGGFTLL